jgi:hypothetical protein
LFLIHIIREKSGGVVLLDAIILNNQILNLNTLANHPIQTSLYVKNENFSFNGGLVGIYETVDEMRNSLVVDVYGWEEDLYFAVSGNWPISAEVEYDLIYKGPVSETITGQVWNRYDFDIYDKGHGHIDFHKNCENSSIDKLKICLPDGQIYTLIKR